MKGDLVLLPILVSVLIGTVRIFVAKRWMNAVEIFSVLLSVIVLFAFHPFGAFVVGPWSSALGVEVNYTHLSFWFILSLLGVWVAFKIRFEEWDSTMESLADYLFAAMYALYISNDMFNVYVTMELSSLISFLMVGYGQRPSRIWAALKYIFLSAVALSFYLVGIVLIYTQEGVLSFGALKNENVSALGLSFVVVALLVKGGTFGLSSWILDVYSKSKEAVSALLSGTSVNMGLYAMMLFYPLLDEKFKSFLMTFGIFSAVTGAIYALGEKERGEILAFSTSSQMGVSFVLLTLSPFYASLYAFGHSIAKSLLFSGRWKIFTFFAIASMIGIPPFTGYFAKTIIVKNMPFFSAAMMFLTSAYSVKLLMEKSEKPKIFEFLLVFFLFFPLFVQPFGSVLGIVEILLATLAGLAVGFFFDFPKLKDVFSLENGIAYEIWALAAVMVWVNMR